MSVFFRAVLTLVFLPVLLPLSFLYGFFAFLNLRLKSISAVKLSSPVISVGNFCVGGSGKTPLTCEVVEFLLKKGFYPVVISKSYKASLEKPAEVLEASLDPSVYGDEAVLIKSKLKGVRVFTGPKKKETAVFADKLLSKIKNKIFVVDDGAQHHSIYKNIKIHVWDMSRPLLDLVPFPLGRSREFWFLGESPNLSIFSRAKGGKKEAFLWALVRGAKLKSQYKVEAILNLSSAEPLNENFALVSGLGNFGQLKRAVDDYTRNKTYGPVRWIEGRDHDNFDWFKAQAGINYVCTEKDVLKLKEKVSEEHLFVVYSEFSKEFKDQLTQRLESLFLGAF